jgi:LuxR family maltose regulon positive regulatory protein
MLMAGEAEAQRAEALALRAVTRSVRGLTEGVEEAARAALALAPEGEAATLALAWQAIGNLRRLRGQPAEARAAFEAGLPHATAVGGPLRLAAMVRLGQVLVMQGRLREAERLLLAALERVGEEAGQLRLYTAEALLRLGDVDREWNALDRALERVNRGLDLAQRADNVVALFTGYFTLAHVQQARGEPALAEQALHQAEQLSARRGSFDQEERRAVHRAWLDLAQGRDAAAWAEAYAASRAAPEAAGRVSDLPDTLLARAWLRQGRYAEAAALAAALRAAAEAAGRGWTALQARALHALALQGQGQAARAARELAQALATAAPEGYVRTFVDEGEPMRRLCLALRDQPGLGQAARGLAQEVLGAFAPSGRGADGSGLVEALSARELDVLRLMAEGGSNQAIADALVISVGTVKSHVNRILGKLAAQNRTEAVARARHFRLL